MHCTRTLLCFGEAETGRGEAPLGEGPLTEAPPEGPACLKLKLTLDLGLFRRELFYVVD